MDDAGNPPGTPENASQEPQPQVIPTPQPEPEAPAPTPPSESPPFSKPSLIERIRLSIPPINIPNPKIIISAIVLVVVIALIAVFAPKLLVTSPPTTTIVQHVNLTQISGCETISVPGTYSFASNINTSLIGGPCILVTASNVWLVGNQHSLTGSGPYTDVPPYSYGIELQGASNVSITGLSISRFSYGIFLNGSRDAKIAFNNLTTETLSGLYLLNSFDNIVQQNRIAHAESDYGGIFLSGGGGNRFINNTLINNVYYGMSIQSTGNNFTQNIFVNNPADIVCSQNAAATDSNRFSGSTCSVNDYCSFAACAINVPFNFSSVRLAPGTVNSCGAIYSPGNYTLGKSISTSSYVSASNPLALGLACIQVFAPNVRLDCNGKQINDSGIGIDVVGSTNVNITNCLLTRDEFGIYTSNAFNPTVVGTTLANNTYGIYLDNTTAGRLSSVGFVNNTYGLFVEQSSGVLFDKILATGNKYGVYTDSGASDVFSGGSAHANKFDFACSPSSYNSTSDLAQGFSCGLTSCYWASTSCNETTPPNLTVYPLNSCKTITAPGNYSMQQDIISPGSCFNIKASNVAFTCNNYTIIGPSPGTAFTVSNVSNVQIEDCNVSKFNAGVNVSNSKWLQLLQVRINQTRQGVTLNNVSLSTVSGVRVNGYGLSAFNFTLLNTSTITDDFAMSGVTGASGFVFQRATHNLILFNNATFNPDSGFKLIDSVNNTIHNNTALSNINFDYVCSGSSSWLYANPVNVNFGVSKSGCKWLVEVSPLITNEGCAGIFQPAQVSLTSDMYYTTGTTCYSVYTQANTTANNTVINCNGHTVYAPNGGTFLNVVNASGVSLSGCILYGFTNGVEGSRALSTSVFNNTFASGGNAVVLNNGKYENVYANWIENSTNGIILNTEVQGSVYNNLLYNNTVGIGLYGGSFSAVNNNTVSKSAVGVYFNGTTLSSAMDNQLTNAVTTGIECNGVSTGSSGRDSDTGGNICSKNVGCSWMKASTRCLAG
jgi:parallel beta-helix repeat protein